MNQAMPRKSPHPRSLPIVLIVARFVELLEINISGKRRSKYRVTIEHTSGAQEVFKSKEKELSTVISCNRQICIYQSLYYDDIDVHRLVSLS